MSHPFTVEILSDEEDDESQTPPPLQPYQSESFLSPINPNKKRRKEEEEFGPNVVVLDDDPTPYKPTPTSLSTPFFVPETPLSFNSDVSFVKCTANLSDSKLQSVSKSSAGSAAAVLVASENKFSDSDLIHLDSDNDYDSGCERISSKDDKNVATVSGIGNSLQVVQDRPVLVECSVRNDVSQVYSDIEENIILEQVEDAFKKNDQSDKINIGKNQKEETMAKKRKMKEEKIRLAEERKLKREQEKLQKEALKLEAAEMKKLQKEQQKWEKGKFCLKSIIAEIDTKVVELGSIGGHLLTRFAEKGLNYRITSNPVERTILWMMTVPEQISELSSKAIVIPYVLLVFEADEFCKLVNNGSLMDHVSGVRSRYPSHTICYLTNKLMFFINKREQAQYKNPSNNDHWKRPPVEEVFSKLTTDFAKVHSRHCRDEAEVADHVVGLTSSLATCQFRKKLTRLSINANGANVSKDFVDRNLIRKSPWLKALVAIPKVQPRFAVAISKKYPTMRSLLSVYMDPSKSVHEKEFLLKDLPTEGLIGNEDRRVGEVCSKRVYRVLMAKNGNIKTDEVEEGADFFR